MELALTYQDLLGDQKGVFENQIEKLQQIVATQCKLTGVNPLSQEMAAGALSIKIAGKRPRDLLNPKVVKYMQFVFSIKDAVSKRETREISAQFGVTATQVRDFFSGQKSRVRKFARLSREKTNDTSACVALHGEIASTSGPNMDEEPVPLDTILPMNIDEGPSCSKTHEALPGMEGADLDFIQNVFKLMRKEESFFGQLKLIKRILRMENPAVLNWFLTEGGLMILATWLSDAANEEQTSLLRFILRVLDYLPLSKALPVHMSAILQSVNKLRFYRTSDISNRARVLLSKWSNMFGKKLYMRKSNGLKSASDLQDEMLLKQSINEVLGNESWDLKDGKSEEGLRFLCDNPDTSRKLDTAQPLKMLPAPGYETNKKRGVLPSHMRERRKVQMVEHPGQRLAVRSPQVARPTSATQSRPLSADDIQKAKMRAQFMQSKHGKAVTYPDEKVKPESNVSTSSHVKPESQNVSTSSYVKPESQNISTPSLASSLLTVSRVQSELEEHRKLDDALSKTAKSHENSRLEVEEPLWKKCRRIQIPWRTPPELQISETWSVGEGSNSKEIEVQKNRIRRERETIYRSTQEIPSNPREPWDREMDPDDSLTPEIPIEQLPDVEPLETPPPSNETAIAQAASTSTENMPAPDLELLAELLKNPELVFALTSGKAGNLSSAETVKLLDMIKANGVGSLSKLAGNDKVEVSLPSPTPSSDPVPNGLKPDFSRNPFSRQPNDHAYQPAGASPSFQQASPATTFIHSQIPVAGVMAAQPSPSLQQWQQAPANLMHNYSNVQQYPTTEMMQNQNKFASSNLSPFGNVKPSPVSILMPPSRSLTPPQQPYLQEPNNPLRPSPVFSESNHRYRTVNDYSNAYGGPPAGAWAGRNNLVGRPEYESWSPDDSPSKRHEYLPGQYYHEPNVNSRHGYRDQRAMQQNQMHPSGSSGYQDHSRNKRWRDNGR